MIYVLGMGHSQPETKITNQFLEDLNIGTNAQWIVDKIGIEERVTTLPIDYIAQTRNEDTTKARGMASMNATDLGIASAKMALEKAGITASQVGMVIVNCCVPAESTPPESQRICAGLDISPKCFDVFTACPAFALHIDFINNYKESELPEYILCISTATLTHMVNYNDRSDGAIWGDGAAAWVISSKHKGKLSVVDTTFMSDPTRCEAVVVDRYGHFHQDGRAVRDFSVRQTVRLVKRIEDMYEIDWNRDIFIGHQANKTMLEQITNNREIPPSNHWHNVTKLGNQAGAGAPAVLSLHWEQIKAGQKIVVAVVGAGLSWGSILFEAH